MRTAVGTLVAAAVALSGCGGDDLPAVAVDNVPTASADACRRLADALPKDLGKGLPRRATTPADPRVAAYGDPPVVVRCGAPPSSTYKTGVQVFDINGVDWFPEQRPGAVVWSTPKAFVNVEVTVPAQWPGDVLARLAPAVKALG